MALLLRSVMRRLVVVTAAAAAVVLVAAPAAQAHDSLLASTPTAGEGLTTLPAEVRLTFGAEPRAQFAAVQVTGPDGRRYDAGAPTVDEVTLVQPLATGGPAGAYTVDWRVVSGDGHAISGQFGFLTTQGSATATPTPAATPTASTPPPTTAPAPAAAGSPALVTVADDEVRDTGGHTDVVIGIVVAVIVVIGGVVGVTLRRRRSTGHERPRRETMGR